MWLSFSTDPSKIELSLLQAQFSITTEYYLILKPVEMKKTHLILKRHMPGSLLLKEATQGPKASGRVILCTEEMVRRTSRLFLCLSNWVQHLFVQNIWCFEVPKLCICWWNNIILLIHASLLHVIPLKIVGFAQIFCYQAVNTCCQTKPKLDISAGCRPEGTGAPGRFWFIKISGSAGINSTHTHSQRNVCLYAKGIYRSVLYF